MRIAWNNVWDDFDILAASYDGVTFPAANTQDPHLATRWRTSSPASQYITLDNTSGEDVNFIAIAGHNLSNSATILFQANDTDSWGAPSVSETLTWNVGHIIKMISKISYNYYRFSIDDSTNPDGYIEIGRLWIGEYLQINPSSFINFSIQNDRNDVVTETEMGGVYGSLGNNFRVFDYSFPPSPFTLIDDLREMLDEVGTVKPVFLMNYDTDRNYIEPCYARITDPLTEEWQGGARIKYNLKLREIV
jgi:hypothetical protein